MTRKLLRHVGFWQLELEPGLFFLVIRRRQQRSLHMHHDQSFLWFLLHRLGGDILGDISSASEKSIMADHFHL